MSEMVLNVSALQETLFKLIPTEKVKLRRSGSIISLIPFNEVTEDECSLLGLTKGSTLTVDKFLAMTREDKLLEELEG